MGVLTYEDAPDNTVLQLLETNQGSVRVISKAASSASIPVAPFRGTYYVDPLFVGIETGSASNPFKTFAAAFAFAALQGIAGGTIIIPAICNIAENIVFPTAAGRWEVTSQNNYGSNSAILSGTIDVSCVAASQRSFTNLQTTGALSGNSPTGTLSRIRFVNCFILGSVTLTGTGTGGWRCIAGCIPGWSGNAASGGFTGVTNVTGEIIATAWQMGNTTCSGAIWLDGCLGTGPLTYSGPAGGRWKFLNVNMNAGVAINSANTLDVLIDGYTASSEIWNGLNIPATVTIRSGVANGSDRRTLANNLALQTLYFDYPAALMTVTGSLTVLTPGTAGNAILQVQYTDAVGVNQTKTVCGPLNIASAAGTEVAASVQFYKGAGGIGGIGWQVTGITTPGALSLNAAANARIER